MAKKTIKLSQLSKDFGMKSKDVLDTFKDLGLEKKSGANADDLEFALFFQKVTKANQIENLDDYVKGVATIRAEKKPEEASESVEKAPAAEAKPDPKAEEKSAPKAEAKPAPKAEEKPAPKAEEKPAPKAEEKPAPKVEEKPVPKVEEKKPETPAQPRIGRIDRPVMTAEELRRSDRPTPQRTDRPGQKGGFDRQQRQDGGRDNRDNRQQGGRRFDNGYSARPQENPFAKKLDNMRREAQGFKPAGSQTPVQKPQPNNTARPAQQAMLEKEKQKQQAAKPVAPTPIPKKEEKKVQKQQFKTITPTVNTAEIKGGVQIGGEYNTAQQKTRVVDMRTSDVNLSKYDERYNEQFFAIANGTDSKAQKQKLKKQDNRGQFAKSAKDKEKAAQEKIKRMEAELARKKQLEITVPDEITVSELALRLKKSAAEVIKRLMLMGEMKGVNDVLDYGTAELIADEFGAKVTKEVVVTIEEKLFTEAEDSDEDLVLRAPVVCVMGHVDHGKTSILDAIRHTNVTRGEAGGITQAIGAYRVKAQDQDITFLDTPGHEAFTAMRMRGAKSTDIAILVVAADDGVMPQTIEAISHAKAAGIDIIVAINKMDKPTANPDNILNQLTQYDLVPEAWGGDVICVPVSALTGMGISDLLDSVLLVAEVKELKANPNKRAKGLVIESRLDRGQGPVATILVQNGTLHQGDYVIVGNAVGRVRLMKDDKGKSIKSAGPSVPVEITGLDDVPQAGDELNAVEDERMAKDLAEQRREKLRQEILAANARVNLDDLFNQIAEGTKTLNVIVKADVAGSAEAVKASLVKLSGEEVKVSVIHSAVGGITESDVMLATASNAIIVGFNVRPDKNALDSAERNKVDIRTHRIIYEIIDEVEAAMKGMLAPTYKEVLLGHAEVRQTIRVPNVGTIAGSYIRDGKITRQAQIRVVRDGIVIFEDKISSLRRFKDDVKEVAEGYECGVGLEKFNDIKEGDILEAFVMEEVKR